MEKFDVIYELRLLVRSTLAVSEIQYFRTYRLGFIECYDLILTCCKNRYGTYDSCNICLYPSFQKQVRKQQQTMNNEKDKERYDS